jgi:hypothetical protein
VNILDRIGRQKNTIVGAALLENSDVSVEPGRLPEPVTAVTPGPVCQAPFSGRKNLSNIYTKVVLD